MKTCFLSKIIAYSYLTMPLKLLCGAKCFQKVLFELLFFPHFLHFHNYFIFIIIFEFMSLQFHFIDNILRIFTAIRLFMLDLAMLIMNIIWFRYMYEYGAAHHTN